MYICDCNSFAECSGISRAIVAVINGAPTSYAFFNPDDRYAKGSYIRWGDDYAKNASVDVFINCNPKNIDPNVGKFAVIIGNSLDDIAAYGSPINNCRNFKPIELEYFYNNPDWIVSALAIFYKFDKE